MAFEKFNLEGKIALITGAAGLLGIEHAAALLESGASVIITDINETGLESVKDRLTRDFDHDKIITKVMDVCTVDSIQIVANDLADQEIGLDILINNAAIDPKVEKSAGMLETSRLENFSLQQWNLQIAVGLTGAFLCSQIFGVNMIKSGGGGVIVNIASDLSVFAPDQRIYRKDGICDAMQPVKPITYSVIKSGLIGMTRYLATYWSSNGVRCNALSPGGVFNGQSEDFVVKLSNLIPLGRMAQADEYKAALQFLCSDASSYMNGQNLVIDGGRSAW